MKRVILIVSLILLLFGCSYSKDKDTVIQKEIIKMLDKAENKKNYSMMRDHIDDKFVHSLGYTKDQYIKELKNYSNNEKKSYRIENYTAIDDEIRSFDLITVYSDDNEEISTNIVKADGDSWTYVPTDFIDIVSFEKNPNREDFTFDIPAATKQSGGQLIVLDIHNNTKDKKYYITEDSIVEVETQNGAYTASMMAQEILPNESKRTNILIDAKSFPKKVSIWNIYDEENKKTDYTLILREIEK